MRWSNLVKLIKKLPKSSEILLIFVDYSFIMEKEFMMGG
jgi:hypothetical protein